MIEILVAFIIYLITDRILAGHRAKDDPNNDEFILLESSPNDTPKEKRETKEMEECIIYEDLTDDE